MVRSHHKMRLTCSLFKLRLRLDFEEFELNELMFSREPSEIRQYNPCFGFTVMVN